MFSSRTFLSIGRALLTRRAPYYVQYYIIGKCNLKCRQCNIVETNSRSPEMSLDQVRKFAGNLRDIGGGIVLLTGGEPFMHPHLPELVDIFVSAGLNVRLQTAGTHYATAEKLQACYDAGARDINVSLDSLDFGTFDYINAVPGSAKNAIETIERISQIFRGKSAILSLGTVLSRFNYLEIPAILKFAQRIGWYVSLVPVHIAARGTTRGFRSYDQLFKLGPEHHAELDSLLGTLLRMKREGFPLFDSERFLRSSVSFLKGQGVTWRSKGVCDSPDLYFAVRPNGDFTTCCDYTLERAPKVYDEDFVANYRDGTIRNREDVRRIVQSCEGCHYGSYPEVSLSVRDVSAFRERVWMVLKQGRGQLAGASVTRGFLAEAEKIRSEHPKLYPASQWQDPRIVNVVSLWGDPERRKAILREDNEVRKLENRVRGIAS